MPTCRRRTDTHILVFSTAQVSPPLLPICVTDFDCIYMRFVVLFVTWYTDWDFSFLYSLYFSVSLCIIVIFFTVGPWLNKHCVFPNFVCECVTDLHLL
jgi:hypothetical protein